MLRNSLIVVNYHNRTIFFIELTFFPGLSAISFSKVAFSLKNNKQGGAESISCFFRLNIVS